MTSAIITQDQLKELLSYNPDTGLFTRLKTSGGVLPGIIANSKTRDGYIVIRVKGDKYKAHRLAFLYMTGEFPLNQSDHINGIPDDNRWLNLRDVTQAENTKNAKIRHDNSSGVPGVYWRNENKKWRAKIAVDGSTVNLGHFDKKEDAIAARKSAELKYNYHPNHGRRA